jgi:hypothetical protein
MEDRGQALNLDEMQMNSQIDFEQEDCGRTAKQANASPIFSAQNGCTQSRFDV